jgi:hypothetical protein
MLNRLAKAGYFNSANGALYAATRRALRKKPNKNDFEVSVAPSRSTLSQLGVSHKAVNTSLEASPSNVKTRSQKEVALI